MTFQCSIYYLRRRFFPRDVCINGAGQQYCHTLYMFTKGSGILRQGATQHVLRQGQLTLTPPGWSLEAPTHSMLYYVCFDRGYRPRKQTTDGPIIEVDATSPPEPSLITQFNLTTAPLLEMTAPNSRSFKILVDQLAPYWWNDSLALTRANGELQAWLAQIFRQNITKRSRSVTSYPHDRIKNKEFKWIRLALKHLEDVAKQGGSVTTVAERMNCTRSHFTRRFTELSGISPGKHLIDFRMRHAHKLLSSTKLPMTRIGRRIGYTSLSSFSRAFHHHFQVTPSQLRQQVASGVH